MISIHKQRAWLCVLAFFLISLFTECAYAQAIGGAHNHEASLWRVLGALLFCSLLGLGGALVLRYRMNAKGINVRPFDTLKVSGLLNNVLFKVTPNKAKSNRLFVVETVRLNFQTDVSLIECDGVGVLIVTTAQGVTIVNPAPSLKNKEAS